MKKKAPKSSVAKWSLPKLLSGTMTRDGERVLLAVPAGQSGPMQFTIVENWQAG